MSATEPETAQSPLAKADAELRAAREAAANSNELAELRAARVASLEEQLAEARKAVSQRAGLDAHVAELEDELILLRLRLRRLQTSLPHRAWARLRDLPGLRSISARRARAYQRELGANRED
jgi:hypothetical protein